MREARCYCKWLEQNRVIDRSPSRFINLEAKNSTSKYACSGPRTEELTYLELYRSLSALLSNLVNPLVQTDEVDHSKSSRLLTSRESSRVGAVNSLGKGRGVRRADSLPDGSLSAKLCRSRTRRKDDAFVTTWTSLRCLCTHFPSWGRPSWLSSQLRKEDFLFAAVGVLRKPPSRTNWQRFLSPEARNAHKYLT